MIAPRHGFAVAEVDRRIHAVSGVNNAGGARTLSVVLTKFLSNHDAGSCVTLFGCVISGLTGNPEWRGAVLIKIKERHTGSP
jgi:hypothetical protein